VDNGQDSMEYTPFLVHRGVNSGVHVDNSVIVSSLYMVYLVDNGKGSVVKVSK